MPGNQLPQPKQLFQDNAWNPLVGGQVFTYDAGTLTPKGTFQNDGLSIANTNPVIVNARGEVAMYGTGLYRIILKDALGNTIYDVDNLSSTSTTFATIASPTFTGDPKAPTPAQFDNDTSIATTAFVRKASLAANQQLIAVNTTLTSVDCGKSFIGSTVTPFTLTLPLAATCADGSRISFSNMNVGALTIARQGADNINNGFINTAYTLGAGGRVTVESYSGSNQWYVVDGSGIGVDQTWQNVTGIRAAATNYLNGSKVISVAVTAASTGVGAISITPTINGVAQPGVTAYSAGAGYVAKDSFLVPPNVNYSVAIAGSAVPALQNWFELR